MGYASWFRINCKKASLENFQFMILSEIIRPKYNSFIQNSVLVELLGLIIEIQNI